MRYSKSTIKKAIPEAVIICMGICILLVYFFGPKDADDTPLVDAFPERASQATGIEDRTPNGTTYVHPAPRFSFSYPVGYIAGTKKEGESHIVVVRSEADANKALQITLSPYAAPDQALTPARLHRDIPDLVIRNAQELELLSGVKTLAFQSVHPALGDTQEIWFVKGGYLYQISAPRTERESITAVLMSLAWPPS